MAGRIGASAGLMLVASILLIAGCATSGFPYDREARSATDIPDHFVVGTHGTTETTAPDGSEGCRNPMVDPRTGTRLRLVRSVANRGDYQVPDSRYGAGSGELLRLDCSTGRVIGIVPE